MFKYLISINPLGLMYGSAGAFLLPENLVGNSGKKFPPEASTISGLILYAHKVTQGYNQAELKPSLFVTGPFWAKSKDKQNFYVPIPWHKIISNKGTNEWKLENNQWQLETKADEVLEPDYHWQTINSWKLPPQILKKNKSVAEKPWKFVSFLHPKIKKTERCVQEEDGLFLENSVQIAEDICLVYLSSHPIVNGWYRFGGENHIVDVECEEIKNRNFLDLLNHPIKRSFALITPGVWGSSRLSYRYPQNESFPKTIQMLTDKPIPYRHRVRGNLGRGRYAVPAGSVYVLEKPLDQPWLSWNDAWFPNEGYSLKRVGCGLSLPITIKGVE